MYASTKLQKARVKLIAEIIKHANDRMEYFGEIKDSNDILILQNTFTEYNDCIKAINFADCGRELFEAMDDLGYDFSEETANVLTELGVDLQKEFDSRNNLG